MKTFNANQITILMLLLIFPMAGCQAINFGKKMDQPVAKKLPNIANMAKEKLAPNRILANQSNPNRMVIIWKDAVVRSGDGQTKKGFGGRVYFYGKGEVPIQVDGQMVVYGYDDTTEHSSTTPERKYVFAQDSFQNHYDPSELGPSYSLWIPWDEVQATEKTICLMPFFETAGGIQLSAGMSEITLPGRKPDIETIEKTTAPAVSPTAATTHNGQTPYDDSRVVLASGIETVERTQVPAESRQPQPDSITQRRVHTIAIPKSLETRISNSPAKSLPALQNPKQDDKLRQAMKQLVDDRFDRLQAQQATNNQNQNTEQPAATRRPAPAGTMRSSERTAVFGAPAPFRRTASQLGPNQ